MIVTPRKARLIMRGQTQHRRTHPRTTKPGTDIPITPGQGKPSLGRARIVSIRHQVLGDITYDEARAEGHRTTHDFKADWVCRHDRVWIGDKDLDDDALLARFAQRWANVVCEVLELSPVADEPRYLASQRDILTGRCDSMEYTTQRGRAIDDLECIPEADQARMSIRAYEASEAQREAFRAQATDTRQRYRNKRLAMLRQGAQ